MGRTRSVMVITTAFPPNVSPGVHRTLGLCRHLAMTGWEVTVITPSAAGAAADPDLAGNVPPEVRTVCAPAWDLLDLASRVAKPSWFRRGGRTAAPAGPTSMSADAAREPRKGLVRRAEGWLSGWLRMPDGCMGWFLPAFAAGVREARRRRPQVIFSSAPAWTAHVVAAAVSGFVDIPLLADFRDPWCGSAYRRYDYASHQHMASVLERLVIRSATRITCAWDGIRRHLVARYPARAQDMETILNGFDEDQVVRVSPRRVYEKECILLHAGTLYGPRSPEPLLAGLRCLRETSRPEAERVRIVFLGPPTHNSRPLMDLAREHSVEGLVTVMEPVSHQEALAYTKGADVALLFGQSGGTGLDPIPAKTYEYIGLEKSVLAVAAGGEALEVLRRGGCRVWSVGGDDPREVAAALCEIVREQGRARPAAPSVGTGRLAFTRGRMAERLAAVLGDVIRRGRCRGPSVGPRGNPEHVSPCASAPAGDQAGQPRPEDDGGLPGRAVEPMNGSGEHAS